MNSNGARISLFLFSLGEERYDARTLASFGREMYHRDHRKSCGIRTRLTEEQDSGTVIVTRDEKMKLRDLLMKIRTSYQYSHVYDLIFSAYPTTRPFI